MLFWVGNNAVSMLQLTFVASVIILLKFAVLCYPLAAKFEMTIKDLTGQLAVSCISRGSFDDSLISCNCLSSFRICTLNHLFVVGFAALGFLRYAIMENYF